jgi:hypothetical protein
LASLGSTAKCAPLNPSEATYILDVTSIRLGADSPRKYVGLAGFGIEIAAVEPIDG